MNPARVLAAREWSASRTDLLCLFAVTFLSALPYLPGLGFYSDDWSIIARSDAAARAGMLASSTIENFIARPVQGFYLALLFQLFGLDPLGYHVVNTAVLATSACLLYLLLLRLGLGRAQSFASVLLLLMLPQLSTVRAWYAAFQVPLSMALMLISAHAQLSFARSGKRVWLVTAVVAALLSIAAYEIFAPLIAGFAVALVVESWRWSPTAVRADRWRKAAPAIAVVLVVAIGILYKIAFSGRAGPIGDANRYLAGLYQLVRPDYDWRVHSGLNIVAALRAYFWFPVSGWASGALTLVSGRAGPSVSAIAAVIAVLSWWRVGSDGNPVEKQSLKRLLLVGAAIFLLGHAIFLIVPAIHFSATGIGTRVQVAAAIGAAMIFVAIIGIATRLIPWPHPRSTMALLITAATVPSFVRLAEIERYWTEAPRLQERVLSAARSDLQDLPPGSTVILDGVCPYHGPAIVFETWWDVGGALTLTLGRPVKGDAVSSRMRLTETGLGTSIYKEPTFYPYGPTLFIYDPRQHLVVRIADRESALRYFENRKPLACPPSYVGRGVEV